MRVYPREYSHQNPAMFQVKYSGQLSDKSLPKMLTLQLITQEANAGMLEATILKEDIHKVIVIHFYQIPMSLLLVAKIQFHTVIRVQG